MKYQIFSVLVAAAALALPLAMGGCDREIAHEREVKVKSDGTVKEKEKVIKESPDGTITKEEKTSTSTTR